MANSILVLSLGVLSLLYFILQTISIVKICNTDFTDINAKLDLILKRTETNKKSTCSAADDIKRIDTIVTRLYKAKFQSGSQDVNAKKTPPLQ